MPYNAFITLVRQIGLAAVRRTKLGREAYNKFKDSAKFKSFLEKFNKSKTKKELDKAKDFRTKNIKPKKKAIEGKGGKGGPTKKKLNANKNEGKPVTGTTKPGTRTKTTTGTTKPGTKSKIPAFIIAAGTIGGGAALMTSNKNKKSGSGMTFKEAFAKARKEKGKLATFTYKGKSYSTATADDVKKAGFKSLREYLNANKK
tara:strand:+ start:571 stop:1173 length:603 start_codon:yes stop_codon:yes gene_type:complete